MTDNEVTALAERARNGDAAALEALMAALEPLVKRWCRPSIQRHPNHGDDILQTARLAVLKALRRPAPQNLHAFVYTWLQNEVTKYLASRRVVRHAPRVTHIDEIKAREDTSWRYTGPVDPRTPEDELLAHEAVAARWRQERRRRCITPACLRLLLQREGLHQDELARCLGVCPSLISRYATGEVRIPPAVADRVVDILQLRDADLAALHRDAEEYPRLLERYTPDRIRAARELLGLSQEDLGQRFVRHGRAHGQPTVSAFEDGRVVPSPEDARLLEALLNRAFVHGDPAPRWRALHEEHQRLLETWPAERIRKAREAAGLTKRELAVIIGLPPRSTNLHSWESGRRAPIASLRILRSLDDVLRPSAR